MKRNIIQEDYFKIKLLSNSQISPNGDRIAYVKCEMNKEKDGYMRDVWITEKDKKTYAITNNGNSDFPCWSPDGEKLLFLSIHEGVKAMYIHDFDKDISEQVLVMPNGVSFPTWSPDGKKIAFISKNTIGEATPYIVCKRLKQKMDELTGFIDYSKESHIFVLDLELNEVNQLTPDDFSLEPPEWSGVSFPSWSNDSKRLTFSAKILDPVERDINPWKANVFVIDIDGSNLKGIKNVVGPASKPVWAKDDKSIYFVGHINEFQRATCQRLCKIDIETEQFEILSEELDRGLDDYLMTDTFNGFNDIYPKISQVMNEIYFVVGDMGKTTVFGLNLGTNKIRCVIGGERKIYSFSLSKDGKKIAFAYSTEHIPNDLAIFDLMTNEEIRATNVNCDFLKEIKLSKQEPVTYESADGLIEHGWIMKPIDYEEGKKYPTILQVHGGPMLAFGWAFTFEFQLLTSLGYAVIFCNPRGSRGYGQNYTYALKDNYGGLDFDDIMRFVDKSIESGFVNEEKMAVTGTSYGGFMTNWIMTHTDRFKAAIPQASVSNWMTMYGLSDFGYMTNELLLMEPFENLMDLWKISPLAYAENVTIPVLILHSEKDMRCPIDQGEQMFVRLKHLGKEVEMVRFPDSNHMMMRIGKPSLRMARLTLMDEFFQRHLKS